MPFDLLATAIRYAMMILVGHLVTRRIIDQSLTEPIIGFAVALSAIVWFWLGKWRPSRFKRDDN